MSSVNDLNRCINGGSSSGGDVAPNNVPPLVENDSYRVSPGTASCPDREAIRDNLMSLRKDHEPGSVIPGEPNGSVFRKKGQVGSDRVLQPQ